MARRELTVEEKSDAQRLKALWDTRFSGEMSQMEAAHRCGWSTQGAFNQYLNGKIPLNLSALIKISSALGVEPGEISPRLSRELELGGRTTAHNDLTPLQPIEAWDSNSPLDPDEVEVPLFREVELAAGDGLAHQIEYNGAKLKFAKSSLRRAGVPEEAAACAFVSGASMEPMLPNGSTIGVDTSAKNIVDGKLYAIDHNGELRVKQVFRIPGGQGLRFHSFNPDKNNFPDEEYSPEKVQAQNIRIIGRVFWSAAFW